MPSIELLLKRYLSRDFEEWLKSWRPDLSPSERRVRAIKMVEILIEEAKERSVWMWE